VQKSSWQKRFSILKNWLYLYPAPEPMPRKRLFWFSLSVVTALAAAFSIFFILYLARKQDAFMTPAEDVGILDQAVWSFIHGQGFHQTICNIVSDTNCVSTNGYSRFAIHFEPILIPLSLFYWIWADPKLLMIVQTVVVASGAFPAFWLARLRLRSEIAGVVIAALYLLYPSLQQAEIVFFHPVVFTAAFLLFTLYFMYTRRTVWVFIFAILAMACKEEIPVVIAFLGLWSLVFQRYWRVGLGLMGLGAAWLGLALLVFHIFSPVGHPILASRYAYLGNGLLGILGGIVLHPVSIIKAHVLEHDHLYYLRLLLSPVNYISLLAPWVLILAVPSLALNLLSSDPNMYQGTSQYNAEIIPILIFATIESLVVILWLVQWVGRHFEARRLAAATASVSGQNIVAVPTASQAGSGKLLRWLQPIVLLLLLLSILGGVLRHDQTYGALPISQDYVWPVVTPHDVLAQRFIDLIPPTASVTAQSSLVPHISQREHIYLYPYGVGTADYIFLDVTSDAYPFAQVDYINSVKNLLLHGNYGIVAAQDGYLLLKRGLPAPGLSSQSPVSSGPAAQVNLPAAFCSFIQVPPQPGATPVQVNFRLPGASGGTVKLVSFQVEQSGAFLQIVSYWSVSQASTPALSLETTLLNTAGSEVFQSSDVVGASWCPTNTWRPGAIIQMTTALLYIGNVPGGPVHVTLALLPNGTASTTMSKEGLPFQIVQAPQAVTALPGKNLLQLQTFTVS
jgi:uncharacterized membrane protein